MQSLPNRCMAGTLCNLHMIYEPNKVWEVYIIYVLRAMCLKGLVTNYGEGGLQNGRGAREVLPLQTGGGGRKK